MKKRLLCAVIAAMAFSTAACTAKTSGTTSAAESTVTEEETTESKIETEEETSASEEEETSAEEEVSDTDSADGKESDFRTGSWDGLTFTNPWLNLVITFPEGSYIYTDEEVKTLLGAGQDILINNGNYTESQLTMAKALTVYDFMVALPDGQSNVQLVYENIKLTTGGKGIEPADYLELVSTQLKSVADMQYETGQPSEVEIAGQTFTKLSATLMGGALCQDYYCIRIGDRMVTMNISYLPDSASTVEELVSGIKPAK